MPPTPAYVADPGAQDAPGKPEGKAADPRKIKPIFTILDFMKIVQMLVVPSKKTHQATCHADCHRAFRRSSMAYGLR